MIEDGYISPKADQVETKISKPNFIVKDHFSATPILESDLPPKKVRKVVFNQNKTRFAIVWNSEHGFTVYDAMSFKVILRFNRRSLAEELNIKLNVRSVEITDLSMLFKTGELAIIFTDRPTQVEFYKISHNDDKEPKSVDEDLQLGDDNIEAPNDTKNEPEEEEKTQHDFS